MNSSLTQAFTSNFLGASPDWYKKLVLIFLVANPIILYTAGPVVAGWALILEFIFTLAMALKCYPLQPGGLLAIEAIALGMASPDSVYHEVEANLQVILLLMFMVAGIYFMRDMLLFVFTKILISVKSKMLLSFLFSFSAAFLSAFLDALTVTAVLITISVGFFSVYHKVASGKEFSDDGHDHTTDDTIKAENAEDLEGFRAFLRSLIMHGAVGTALGGVCTTVGEPQNLLIAERAGWDFIEFFIRMSPVTMPVLVFGLLTCLALERLKIFGYGSSLPIKVREVLQASSNYESSKRTVSDIAAIIVQVAVAIILILGLSLIHI